MNKVKRALSFVLLSLVMISGVLFGCRGKYDNLKVTSDRESGLQLYLDDNTDSNTGTVTFTVTGAGDKISTNLKFSFEGNEESKVVNVTDTKVSGASTTLTLQAISGGSTTLVALTEEGAKTCSVKIDCIKKLTSIEVDSSYKPAIFNQVGQNLKLDTKKVIFSPSDTTQKSVTYSTSASDSYTLTAGGLLTITKPLPSTTKEISVVVVSSETGMTGISSEIKVSVVQPIAVSEKDDGIELNTTSSLFKDGLITLATNSVDDSSMNFTAKVNTDANISLTYRIASFSDLSLTSQCAMVEKVNDYEFAVRGNEVGNCKL